MGQDTIIKIKRGSEANLPELNDGELAYTKDLKNLYIGTSEGNKKILSSGDGGGLTFEEHLALIPELYSTDATSYYEQLRAIQEFVTFEIASKLEFSSNDSSLNELLNELVMTQMMTIMDSLMYWTENLTVYEDGYGDKSIIAITFARYMLYTSLGTLGQAYEMLNENPDDDSEKMLILKNQLLDEFNSTTSVIISLLMVMVDAVRDTEHGQIYLPHIRSSIEHIFEVKLGESYDESEYNLEIGTVDLAPVMTFMFNNQYMHVTSITQGVIDDKGHAITLVSEAIYDDEIEMYTGVKIKANGENLDTLTDLKVSIHASCYYPRSAK